jgi:cytidylate kinase
VCAFSLSGSLIDRLSPVMAAVQSTGVPVHPSSDWFQLSPGRPAPKPFITISRQAGAGGSTLAERLVERLNQRDDGSHPWTCWDRELTEKIAAERRLSKQLIDSLEENSRSWFENVLAGLSSDPEFDEVRVYHYVAGTIRALAQAGHVVLVGRGAAFVTRDMPGGVHVRLVAPLAYRVAETARRLNGSVREAARWVRRTDRARRIFYRAHWPKESIGPESFAITLNTAIVPIDRIVDCIIPLIAADSRVLSAGQTRSD